MANLFPPGKANGHASYGSRWTRKMSKLGGGRISFKRLEQLLAEAKEKKEGKVRP